MMDYFGQEKHDESLIDILNRQSRCKTWGHLLGSVNVERPCHEKRSKS